MKSNHLLPVAIEALSASIRTVPSNYPQEFAKRMHGREKRPLGSLFGIDNFGVNLTMLLPGAISALRHGHSRQDEFVYVLQGTPTLRTDEGDTLLAPGMCAGFPARTGNGHQLLNLSNEECVYLEVGDRSSGDEVYYPDDDLQAILLDGRWQFTHKDGTPY
ncbi:cupin domain-containing protein [Simplicispira psychrophila]|uniref:cupin domain-containing protein n=1 Tax=Simplicispira psychrophila TaxID=80882 RepID=UPI00048722FF|nr:cupin domain-containing protein [Simplicispira psychrophila]